MIVGLYRVEWRSVASDELLSIVRYIAQDNPALARRFDIELRNKVGLLAQYPELGRVGRPILPGHLRELVVHRHYIVFYRVLDKARVVEILAVKHTARQIP